MNEILADARVKAYDYREEKRLTKSGLRQMDMFSMGNIPDPARPVEAEVDLEALITQILDACGGRHMTFRDVLHKLAKSAYTKADMIAAMREMKKRSLVRFDCSPSELRNSTAVMFA